MFLNKSSLFFGLWRITWIRAIRVSDPSLSYRDMNTLLRQIRAINHLNQTSILASLTNVDPVFACVSHHVSSCWFVWVSEHDCGCCLHLVCGGACNALKVSRLYFAHLVSKQGLTLLIVRYCLRGVDRLKVSL